MWGLESIKNQRVTRFICEYAAWLFIKGAKGWIAAIPIIVPFVVCLLIPVNQQRVAESVVRYFGIILQFLGTGTVAYGLCIARQQFGRPTVLEAVLAWLRERPKRRPSYVAQGGVVTGGSAAVEFAGRVKAGPDSSIEHRVQLLECDVDDLYHNLGILKKDVSRNQVALENERVNREKALSELDGRLETAMVGNLHVSRMGVLWMISGLALVTFPDRIAVTMAWIRTVVGLI